MIILSGLTSEIFLKHLVLINDFQKLILNRVKLSLQFIDIVLFTCLKLFHNFFLSVQFSLNVFTFGHGLICASLKLFVLLSKYIQLSFICV